MYEVKFDIPVKEMVKVGEATTEEGERIEISFPLYGSLSLNEATEWNAAETIPEQLAIAFRRPHTETPQEVWEQALLALPLHILSKAHNRFAEELKWREAEESEDEKKQTGLQSASDLSTTTPADSPDLGTSTPPPSTLSTPHSEPSTISNSQEQDH